MKDEFAAEAAALGDNAAIHAILEKVCAVTGMGFVALARVTETRWVACQVLDKIEFGLNPGDELDIKTTICNDIRECGQRVVIDHVGGNDEWRTHPTPMLYGFESYASLPIFLEDGSFFGTLCAIDPHPRKLNSPATLAALERCARRIVTIVSQVTNKTQPIAGL